MSGDTVKVITWEKLYKAVHEDQVLVKLMEVVLQGFPQSSHDVDEDLKQYHRLRHNLHVAGCVVCYKDRAVIPVALRAPVLETIYAAHQGVTGMICRIEETVFWPGISTDVIKTRGGCLTCVKDAPSQPAGSPVAPPVPSFPEVPGKDGVQTDIARLSTDHDPKVQAGQGLGCHPGVQGEDPGHEEGDG